MFIRILNSEMELATGCTEPGAVALTAAEAGCALRRAGANTVEEVLVSASVNIIKNAMSAGIPGTSYEGMDYAAAIGAPGVPGGTVMASLGLITGVLMFDDAGTALMLAIFALQDSFGTACNVTGDGALTLMLTGYAEKHGIQENQNIESPVL